MTHLALCAVSSQKVFVKIWDFLVIKNTEILFGIERG